MTMTWKSSVCILLFANSIMEFNVDYNMPPILYRFGRTLSSLSCD
jgi:hypothetical protein